MRFPQPVGGLGFPGRAVRDCPSIEGVWNRADGVPDTFLSGSRTGVKKRVAKASDSAPVRPGPAQSRLRQASRTLALAICTSRHAIAVHKASLRVQEVDRQLRALLRLTRAGIHRSCEGVCRRLIGCQCGPCRVVIHRCHNRGPRSADLIRPKRTGELLILFERKKLFKSGTSLLES